MKKNLLFAAALLLGGAATAQTSIYSEDFESGLPGTWSQTTLSTDGGWNAGNAASLSSAYFPFDPHTNFVGTNDDDCDCDKSNDFLMTDNINLGSVSQAYMSFDIFYYGATYNGATESLTLEASTDGGTTWNVVSTIQGAGTWNTVVVDVSAYAGANVMFGWRYNDAGGWLYGAGLDDVAVYEPASYDLEGVSLVVPNYAQTNSTVPVTGTVYNAGGMTVTSFDINYTVNGGSVVTKSITGVNIAPLSAYNFTATDYVPATAGVKNFVAYASNINGNADQNTANDQVMGMTNVYDTALQRMPLYEVFTSSTCGPCTPGNANFHSIVNPDAGNWVAVKYQQNFPGTGDPYCTDESVNRRNFYAINSIPRMEIDGGWDGNANSFTTALHNEAKGVPAFVNIEATYSIAGQKVDIDVKVTAPLQDVPGNYVLHAAIIEGLTDNNVKTNGETEFHDVMKKMVPNENGSAMTALSNGSSQNFTLSHTFQGNYRLSADGQAANRIDHATEHSVEEFEDLKVVVWVQNTATNEIAQAANAARVAPVGVIEAANFDLVSVYPNPFAGSTNLELNLAQASDVTVSVVNIMGEVVAANNYGKVAAGSTNLTLDAQNLAAGMYTLLVNVNGEQVSKRINIVK